MQSKRFVMTALVAALLGIGLLGGTAFGAEGWRAEHPRRAEVNRRLHNQFARIKEGVQSGKLSTQQAQTLHQADHQIRQEERADAAQHGSHITKAEQKQLNRQENAASKKIYEEKHPSGQ